ncbi:helix-turn-helix domain-containing protein [Embleya scabrispora]|uniref:helix-turn-helix domain-containing protein n=1 Tax=Embleya scabrispora TaxID=159449 RepID=UPI000477A572|nr:helix-turn-helix domain-containing protein [Embleya scabrispora]MYS86967.1 helix-turn-helix domain-containing protein [Streptomyces sp. SID5474]
MTDPDLRRQALSLLQAGISNADVARRLCVPKGTVGYWLHMERFRRGELPARRGAPCFRCHDADVDRRAYAYLLGLYLGDGHIVAHPRSYSLSISCANAWPGLMQECANAITRVLPGSPPNFVPRQGCKDVKRYSQHWPCLFPQHGPGRKHERSIVLEPWQNDIVRAEPWGLVRGLIHSDGCRNMNWTTRMVDGERKRYEYPRYLFANESMDIMRILTTTLNELGVEWRFARRNNLSVARRASVALMDRHIGPKY